MRVAVIDSGVHPDHPHIDGARLLPGAAIASDGTLSEEADATLDRLGHGTAVTAAIQEKAPDALILPVRVFHDALKTSARALALAIGWSIEQGADVINLSLGTTNAAHREGFAAVAARAAEAGALIVAAREADGTPCWPGALDADNVLGVGLDWDCPRETWRVQDGVLFASGYPRPIPGVPPRRNLYGISFATAQASGFAARTGAGLPPDGNRAERLRALLLSGAELPA
ncbi:S8 family serine peptidase [Novosphingobium sp. NBM11]|uniref:subtilisin-like serine protease QhpE n=1 Tax=Novosphingobium sp. NBM11 TaxID=2596914 RepID=UPI0028163D17|nr:S8 family serine peptidase [Novosphingobium sp. NBM11]